ncbi:MAG: sulfurtransferase TusA family protein [Pseudomonadota bacterium]
MSRHTLDARRLLCPLPVIRTQNAAKKLAPGDVLEVTCTDPGAESDIPAWCRINGHEVIGIEHDAGELVITLRIKGAP